MKAAIQLSTTCNDLVVHVIFRTPEMTIALLRPLSVNVLSLGLMEKNMLTKSGSPELLSVREPQLREPHQ
jgi:hypothetical protein